MGCCYDNNLPFVVAARNGSVKDKHGGALAGAVFRCSWVGRANQRQPIHSEWRKSMGEKMDRRSFIGSLVLIGSGLYISGCGRNRGSKEESEAGDSEEEQVTPGEDLMREHGVLRRVLLVYEEVDRRNRAGKPQMGALGGAAGIVKRFIHNYHEKLEEEYIFPRFRTAHKEVDLVKTLETQHEAGRKVTDRIISVADAGRADNQTAAELGTLIGAFTRMYRPHAAREDTVVFRLFPGVVGQSEYKKLGNKFEDREKQMFGEGGFVKMLGRVEAIEKNLGIYDLTQFTPK